MYQHQTNESTRLTQELRIRPPEGGETNSVVKIFSKLYRTPLPPGFSQFPSCKIILLIVLLHRLHVYSCFNFVVGLTATRNHTTYLHINITNEDSTVTAQLFLSCARLLSPITGMVADMFVPRVKMMSFCLFVSFIGSLIQSSFHTVYETGIVQIPDVVYYTVHVTALIFLAIGSSGAYALLVPVGVDQMEGASETRLKSYFTWHFWFINLGALVAAAKYLNPSNNYSDLHRSYVHLASSYLATLSIWLALVILKISNNFGLIQKNKPPRGTPLKEVVGVIKCAYTNKYKKHEDGFATKAWFDHALVENGGKYSYAQIQDVKTFFKILGVLISLIWYFGVDNLYNSIFPLQGAELSQANDNFESTEVIFFADCLTLLLVLPIIEMVRIWFNKLYFGFKRILNKVPIGIIFGFLAILIALSLNIAFNGHSQKISIAVIIPQTVCIALSECFAFVGTMEFVYAQSPHQMIGLLFGVFQSIIGIGYYIPTIIYYILQRISNCYDGNNCRECLVYWPSCFLFKGPSLNYVYYTVYAIITFGYIFLFIFVLKCYKRRERQRIEVWPK